MIEIMGEGNSIPFGMNGSSPPTPLQVWRGERAANSWFLFFILPLIEIHSIPAIVFPYAYR
jgi:hypothetical protein